MSFWRNDEVPIYSKIWMLAGGLMLSLLLSCKILTEALDKLSVILYHPFQTPDERIKAGG